MIDLNVRGGEQPAAKQRLQIYYLDDGYDLAVAGTYGSMDDIERALRELVIPYAQQLAARQTDRGIHLAPNAFQRLGRDLTGRWRAAGF